MSFETAELSKAPHELRVRTFGGTIVSRHSAQTDPDGRYVFHLAIEERPAECVDELPGGAVIKGHRISKDGVYDIVSPSYCRTCDRGPGIHVRPGAEVQAWLKSMPEACTRWWQEQGCTGEGFITVGGDDVQGYVITCNGCEKCTPVSDVPV